MTCESCVLWFKTGWILQVHECVPQPNTPTVHVFLVCVVSIIGPQQAVAHCETVFTHSECVFKGDCSALEIIPLKTIFNSL